MKICIIGSGVAGLSAAWFLSKNHHVTLLEASSYLGGHAHTVDVTLNGITAPVDTGFLVLNDQTYPNLLALYATLGVCTVASEMSLSVKIENKNFEWSGSSLKTLLAKKRNWANPFFWSMLKDILRFNRESLEVLSRPSDSSQTLGAFLDTRSYGKPFREGYLLPMAASIWSCPTREMLRFPVRSFLQFCQNHGLLQIMDRPQWRTVVGGSRDYVARLARGISEIRLNTPALAVNSADNGVIVTTSRCPEVFDTVIMASHTDQTLALLKDANQDERRILSSIHYQRNRVVLHRDPSFLPERRQLWSSWNYLSGDGATDERPVSVSYWINRLQPLPFTEPVLVTLNPFREPSADKIIETYEYDHPVFDSSALQAQSELPLIQGKRGIWFCGAWTGYGFHEDGLKSGMAVAQALGADTRLNPPEQHPIQQKVKEKA